MFRVFWIHFRFNLSKHPGWVSSYNPEIGHILYDKISSDLCLVEHATNLGDNAASTDYYTSAKFHAREYLYIAANPAILADRDRLTKLRTFGSIP